MTDFKPLESDVNPSKTIDAKGYHSPVPLLRLKKEIAQLKSDEVIQLDCTDEGTRDDIYSWCVRMKHKYLGEVTDFDYSSHFVMKK